MIDRIYDWPEDPNEFGLPLTDQSTSPMPPTKPPSNQRTSSAPTYRQLKPSDIDPDSPLTDLFMSRLRDGPLPEKRIARSTPSRTEDSLLKRLYELDKIEEDNNPYFYKE